MILQNRHAIRGQCTRERCEYVFLGPSIPRTLIPSSRPPSTGVIEHDLPALRSLAPHERKDAVVFLCFALLRTFEMEASRDHGELWFAARSRKQAHLDIFERERAHLLAVGVVPLIALQDLFVSLAYVGADEGGFRRMLV